MMQSSARSIDRIQALPGVHNNVSAIAGPDANGVTCVGGGFTAFNAPDTGYGALVNTSNGAGNASSPEMATWTVSPPPPLPPSILTPPAGTLTVLRGTHQANLRLSGASAHHAPAALPVLSAAESLDHR